MTRNISYGRWDHKIVARSNGCDCYLVLIASFAIKLSRLESELCNARRELRFIVDGSYGKDHAQG